MERLVLFVFLCFALGCKDSSGSSPPPETKQAVMPPVQPVQRQVVITDEHGTRTVTVDDTAPRVLEPIRRLPKDEKAPKPKEKRE